MEEHANSDLSRGQIGGSALLPAGVSFAFFRGAITEWRGRLIAEQIFAVTEQCPS